MAGVAKDGVLRVEDEGGGGGSSIDQGDPGSSPWLVTSGFNLPPFNAIVPTFASTTDTYTYKTGGTGGTTVAVIVITYTDSTKAVQQSIVRTS